MTTTFEELIADWDMPFVGSYVNKQGRYVSLDDIPLISHVTDNLYVGGCVHDVDLGDFFTHVFSLYKWENYQHGPDTVTHQWTMFDDPRGVQVETLKGDPLSIEEVADGVVEALELGGNVLVHCQAGINRSNLTAALVLRKWKGLTSAEAIAMLREKRGAQVLANRSFEDFLLSLDQE